MTLHYHSEDARISGDRRRGNKECEEEEGEGNKHRETKYMKKNLMTRMKNEQSIRIRKSKKSCLSSHWISPGRTEGQHPIRAQGSLSGFRGKEKKVNEKKNFTGRGRCSVMADLCDLACLQLFCFSNYHGNNASSPSSSQPGNRKQSQRRSDELIYSALCVF